MGWRLYAWALVVLLAYAHSSILLSNPTGFDVVDAVLSVVAALGVVCFAHAWRILSQRFWRKFLVAFIAWELIYELVLCAWLGLGQRDSQPGAPLPLLAGVVAGLVVLALLLPAYIALFKYAFSPSVQWQAPRAA